jgi:hypothetical protein
MKNIFFLLTSIIVAIAIVPSCKKDKKKGCMDPISINYDEEAEEDDQSCMYAGTGGSITLVAKPEHHGVPIISKVGYPDSAFIKFNAVNSPGSNASAYDLVLAGEVGEDHVHIEGLKPGKYYIFMTGMDSTGPYRVFGGIPITLTQSSGEVVVRVPVAEAE